MKPSAGEPDLLDRPRARLRAQIKGEIDDPRFLRGGICKRAPIAECVERKTPAGQRSSELLIIQKPAKQFQPSAALPDRQAEQPGIGRSRRSGWAKGGQLPD
ncbi:MAG TPA: hypothetical protein VGN91_00100 [Bosea sp. (in: a-proteobacteria)]|nr:hypothetical protein [Bosea sp. (in: a-proteobacteria)]